MGVTNGAMNSAGYSGSIAYGRLPPPDHLSYPGLFNELRFNVGPKTDKVLDLHHGYARFQFAESKFDSEIHDYLPLFLKGKDDGQPRAKERRLNSVICLDISGSMNSGLGRSPQNQEEPPKSRIALCRQAIKMFISKLEPEDSVGMTTFDGKAHLIFDPVLKKNLQNDIYEKVDAITASGANDLMDGFNLSKSMLLKQMATQKGGNYENRVIILSDVCDNSIDTGIQKIKKAAHKENIHLTIIGISTDFQSRSCQALVDTEGFNYFCAVSDEDILKYVFEKFDYTFFPSARDITITLQSDNLNSIEIFGAPDLKKKVQPFEQVVSTSDNTFEVTKIRSVFPSQIQIEKNQVFTVGGLILVKLQRKIKNSSFKGRIRLTYKDLQGQSYQQLYDIDYNFHPEEQFLSDQLLRSSMTGFIYTAQMRTILEKSQNLQANQIYNTFYEMLGPLKELCPEKKLQDYQNIVKIIENYKPVEKEPQQDAKEPAKALQEVKPVKQKVKEAFEE